MVTLKCPCCRLTTQVDVQPAPAGGDPRPPQPMPLPEHRARLWLTPEVSQV